MNLSFYPFPFLCFSLFSILLRLELVAKLQIVCVHTKRCCAFVRFLCGFLMNINKFLLCFALVLVTLNKLSALGKTKINKFLLCFALVLVTLHMMKLQTKVEIGKSAIEIKPADRMLFVGSCFADNIGNRFIDNRFRAVVNPYGVMYNPASIYHTVSRLPSSLGGDWGRFIAVFTLGTNHVYIEKATGEIVDNCQKRPQRLFEEKELTVDDCVAYLKKAIGRLRTVADGKEREVAIILTVSPIRYAKYGFHGSRLSKSTLLLAADVLTKELEGVEYFPAYEIMNDELRDYRFYEPDMLHPSAQAVDYIYEQFKEMFFGEDAKQMEKEWQPIKQALSHRPFNPDSEEYKTFLAKAKEEERNFLRKWKIEELITGNL